MDSKKILDNSLMKCYEMCHYAVPGRHDAVTAATMSPGQKYDMLISKC